MRKEELFKKREMLIKNSISLTPPQLFKQERDWTCSIGCIRTLLSAITNTVPSEDEIIKKYKIEPNNLYSKDIKDLNILYKYDVKYGCDKDLEFDKIIELMQKGYYIMLESMVHYSHWMVLIGYFTNSEDIENYQLLFFDPYYNEIRLIRADEFIDMWADGEDSDIQRDYIALRPNENFII